MSWLKKLIRFRREEVPGSVDVKSTRPSDQFETPPFVAFQPHNEIERLLMDAAINADARVSFQQALLDAELYAATPEAPEINDVRTISKGERLSLLNVQSPDGKKWQQYSLRKNVLLKFSVWEQDSSELEVKSYFPWLRAKGHGLIRDFHMVYTGRPNN